jgi:broad specificity phosphatase PhoE
VILVRHGQSEFNVVYGATREDPGIVDPHLTELGRAQIAAAADALADELVCRIVASPYTRALETAEIIARRLDLPITVEPLIGERAVFACDLGTSPAELARRWPRLAFGHLTDPWWPAHEEPEDSLHRRCGAFRRAIAACDDWREVVVVTHWGFIRALTGLGVDNGAALRVDPTRPDAAPVVLHPREAGTA